MRTWNYRLCKIPYSVFDKVYMSCGIYEVYYDEDKNPISRTEQPAYPTGNNELGEDALVDFDGDMNAYIRATVLPILEEVDGKLVEVK